MKSFTLISLSFLSAFAFAKPTLDVGLVKNKKGDLVIIEKHLSTYDGQKLLTLHSDYFDLEGKKFAELRSDFSKKPYLPEYTTMDERFDRFESLKIEDNKVVLSGREKKGKKLNSKTLDYGDEMVAGQGLHNFIRDHFKEIIEKDKKFDIRFLTPVNQGDYGFRIKKLKSTTDQAFFRVEFDSWLMRLVAPHIDTLYSLSPLRLLQYKGPYHLLDKDQDSQSVTIDYLFDQEAIDVLKKYKIPFTPQGEKS